MVPNMMLSYRSQLHSLSEMQYIPVMHSHSYILVLHWLLISLNI